MRQLPLFALRSTSVFASYVPGPNQVTLDILQGIATPWRSPVVWLYGAHGVGKTHLLQALCAQAGERAEPAAYLPLRELDDATPELLSGCEELRWVCIDDVDRVIGDLAWERAFFKLYTEFEDRGGKLVCSASFAPAAVRIGLPDLASRLNAAVILRVQELNDEQRGVALKIRAARRGAELPDDTIAYLLRRLPRDMSSLCAFIDTLDEASLIAQRRLTIPFVKEVLGGGEGS
jgi:DnaA family protein